jgi:hypothetical protein
MEFSPTTVPESAAVAKTVFDRLNETAAAVASLQSRLARIRERNLSYPPELSARIAAAMERPPAVPPATLPVPVPRRQRKRSLATVLAAARKAGADRVIIDGAAIVLSPAAAAPAESNGNEFDQWMAKHAH